MIDTNTGRTWGNAPSGVRNARALAWLGLIGTGLLLIVFAGLFAMPEARAAFFRSPIMYVYAVMIPIYFPLYIWLLIGLKRGIRAAYYVQMVVAIVGLIGFPIGTIINGYILFQWFRPETQAWFGV